MGTWPRAALVDAAAYFEVDMNRDDLFAVLAADMAGWLDAGDGRNGASLAASAHNVLLNCAGLRSQSKRASAFSNVDRRRVIDAINGEATRIIDAGEGIASAVRDINAPLSLDFEGSGTVGNRRLRIWSKNQAQTVWKALVLGIEIRRLPVKEQPKVLEAIAAKAERAFSEMYLLMTGDLRTESLPDELVERHQAFSRLAARLKAPKLSAAGTQIVEREDIGDWQRAVPIMVHRNASDAELLEASKVFMNLAKRALTDIPHDKDFPVRKRRHSERLWQQLNECGAAFRVISVWLRALAENVELSRCELCYRHVGGGQKRFCTLHKRTSHERQATRDIHVGEVYRSDMLRVLSSQATADALRSRIPTEASPEHTLLAKQMLCPWPDSPAKPLLGPAAALATFLHRVRPYASPAADSSLQAHFLRMLATARAPFLAGADTDSAWQKVNELRSRAPLWLTWRTFFLTLFADSRSREDREAALMEEQFGGLDPDHPMALGFATAPRALALDVLHLRTWTMADRAFDQRFYADREAILKLRRASPGARPLSLRAIGARLGMSHEAVRKVLVAADTLGSDPNTGRRRRLLPGRRADADMPERETSPL